MLYKSGKFTEAGMPRANPVDDFRRGSSRSYPQSSFQEALERVGDD